MRAGTQPSVTVRNGKGGRFRVVPAHSELVDAFRSVPHRSPSDKVFTGRGGKLDFAQNLKKQWRPSLWRGTICGWRWKVFHCPQLTQIFRNSRSLCIIHLQITSVMPLEMCKVQASDCPPGPRPGGPQFR